MCDIGPFQKLLNIPADQPLVGYRWFRVDRQRSDNNFREVYRLDPLIASANTWHTPIAKAHDEPAADNGPYGRSFNSPPPVGLHVFHTLREAVDDPPHHAISPFGNTLYAMGEVLYWGPTAIHMWGSRAQYARIVKLAASSGARAALDACNPWIMGMPRIDPYDPAFLHSLWRPE